MMRRLHVVGAYVTLLLIGALTQSAAAQAISVTIDSPAESALTTPDDTMDLTVSGAITGTLSFGAYVVAPGEITDPDLIPVEAILAYGEIVDTSYSFTVTLAASEAGETYSIYVFAWNDVFELAVAGKVITLTIESEDIQDELLAAWDEVGEAVQALADEAWATIQAYLDAGDTKSAKKAREAFVDDAKDLIKAIKKESKAIIKAETDKSVKKELKELSKEKQKELNNWLDDVSKEMKQAIKEA